jgi:hypothetical protein
MGRDCKDASVQNVSSLVNTIMLQVEHQACCSELDVVILGLLQR